MVQKQRDEIQLNVSAFLELYIHSHLKKDRVY